MFQELSVLAFLGKVGACLKVVSLMTRHVLLFLSQLAS